MTAIVLSNRGPLSYFFSYGFLGGPAHSRRLRIELDKNGFTPATRIDQADIVIAHSAGCWAVTADVPAKLIIFVGMPLHNGHRLATFNKSNVITKHANGKHHVVLHNQKKLYSLFYMFKQPRRNIAIIKKAAKLNVPPVYEQEQVVFIMNEHDPWPRTPALEQQIATTDFCFIGLPGSHTDIFYNPARYVAIINYYAQRILAPSKN